MTNMGVDVSAQRVLALHVLGLCVEVHLAGRHADSAHALLRRAWSRCLAEEGTRAAGGADGSANDVLVLKAVVEPDPDRRDRARKSADVVAPDPETVAHLLSSAITLAALEHLGGSRILLHAAALSDPGSGATAVFVGGSGAGKTTLCAELGQRLGYVTDEAVALGTDGQITPYAKPLSVGASGSQKAQVSPDQRGLRPTPSAPALQRLFVLDRRPDAPEQPCCTPVPILEALAAVATQSSHLKRLPRPLHQLADVITQAGGLTRLSYRDSADLVPLAETLVAPQ